jgi:hypothetical protein
MPHNTCTPDRLSLPGGASLRERAAEEIPLHVVTRSAHVSRYEEEAREGHYVIEVVVEQPGQRELAVATLKAHGAHFINVYSRWTIEEIGR